VKEKKRNANAKNLKRTIIHQFKAVLIKKILKERNPDEAKNQRRKIGQTKKTVQVILTSNSCSYENTMNDSMILSNILLPKKANLSNQNPFIQAKAAIIPFIEGNTR
jgi:hypothetical protein